MQEFKTDDPCNFTAFIDRPVSQTRLDRTNSVTFYMKQCWRKDRESELLKSLGDRLRAMHNLSSVSLKMTFPRRSWVEPERCLALASTIRALPASVKYLELDNCSLKICEGIEEQNHICIVLAELLHQLTSLRLVGMRICQRLFREVIDICPSLKDISINSKSQIILGNCESPPSFPSSLESEYAIDDILEAAKSLVDRTLLPSIESFVIVGVTPQSRQTQKSSTKFAILHRADILRQTVTLFPYKRDYGIMTWMRFWDLSICKEVDLFGDLWKLEDFVEDHGWIQYCNGTRLHRDSKPASFLTLAAFDRFASVTRATSDMFYLSAMAEADTFREDRPSLALYFWEERHHKQLIHVQTSNELRVPRLLERERPLEEIHLDPNSELAKIPKSHDDL